MAKLFKTRSDNDIKNKWYSMKRTQKRIEDKFLRELGIDLVGSNVEVVAESNAEELSTSSFSEEPADDEFGQEIIMSLAGIGDEDDVDADANEGSSSEGGDEPNYFAVNDNRLPNASVSCNESVLGSYDEE